MTPASSLLLSSDWGHVIPPPVIPMFRAVLVAFWFSWLLMWCLRTQVSLPLAASEGGASLDWFMLQALNFVRCCADQRELRGFKRDHNFPKSHNFPYDVKLLRINSAIWERHPKRAWAEFVSSYGTSYVWLKPSNETRILTLCPLLETTRSRKASWLEITGPKWRNKLT